MMFSSPPPQHPESTSPEVPVWIQRALDLCLRLALIFLGAWIALHLPFPLLDDWLPVKNVVVAITAIVLSGKSLYDTLFFDRYWP